MEAERPVSSRAVLGALALGFLPLALALWAMPQAPELPRLEIWKPLDLPLAGVALLAWLLAAYRLRHLTIPERAALPLALLLAIVPTAIGTLYLPTTVSNDERAYLLQAEMFAAGEIDAPLPAVPEALRRRQIHEDEARGRIYAKYPPGTAAALAPGAAVGWPALMVMLAGLADVLLLAALARRMGVERPGTAALLLAACPLFLLLQTSYQSEVFTLPAALAGYLALLRAREPGARRAAWGAAVGACAGWIFLTRPLTGLLFALSMAPGLLLPGGGRAAPGWRALAGAVAGGLPFLALMLLYQRALTGDAMFAPYAAYAARFSPWDVYPLFASEYSQAPVTAFLQGLLRQAARWLPTLFGVFGAAVLGFWGLARLRREDGGAGLTLAVLLPLAYALHWYPGHWAYLGPVYGFEVLGLMIVAALRLLQAAPAPWRGTLPVVALAAGLGLFATRLPFLREKTLERLAPERTAAAAQLPAADAVVLLPWFRNPGRLERSLKLYTPSAHPFGDGVVFVRQLENRDRTLDALRALGLAGRQVWRFVPDEALGGRLEIYEP